MKKNKNIYFIIVSLIIIFFISKYIIDIKTNDMIIDKYKTTALEMQEQAKTMINEKKNATLSIATTLSKNADIKNSLTHNNYTSLRYDKLSQVLKEFSEFKNVWFEVISNKGLSEYRSWSKTSNFLLSDKKTIEKLLKNPQTITTITTTEYDMVIKCFAPIYNNNKLIGYIKVITHFNSIYLNLLEKDIESILLVDKKYKNLLAYPFTKSFINDYYIALLHTKQNFIDYIKLKGVEAVIHTDDLYFISNELNHIGAILKIPDTITGEDMGYFLLFKDLNKVDLNEIQQTKVTFLSVLIITMLFLTLLVYYFVNKRFIKKIKSKNRELESTLIKIQNEKKKNDSILNSLPNMIVLSNGKEMKFVNKAVMNFFDQYETLEELKQDHPCICDLFLDIGEDHYITNKEIEMKTWLDHVLNNSHINYKACMLKEGIKYHFVIKANRTNHFIDSEEMIVVSLTDITNEKRLATELQINEDIMINQSKHAAMGELIGMIAHQWKQPISVINMVSNNIAADIELDLLEVSSLPDSMSEINEMTKHLSNTIDDFRTFFKPNKQKEQAAISSVIDKALSIIGKSLENNNIQLEISNRSDSEISMYINELVHVVINIINNSKDAILQSKVENGKILLDVSEDERNVKIVISDNAGGIPKEHLEKIGTRYFTTKDDKGTGLGLYMSKTIIDTRMSGKLSWYNIDNGASFWIEIPK